jgi:Iron-containing redox enzyme
VPGASDRLSGKLELVLAAYAAPGRRLLDHPEVRDLYPAYAAAGSYVSRVTVPLMEAALARARVLAPADAVAAGLTGYLEHHIPEEMHGDEPGDDLIDDLAAVGVDTAALRLGPLPEKVAALIGAQFFRIRHAHPVAILGFLWLEMYPPHAATVELLIERTGLPRAGFRQLLLHSELDVRHGQELRELLDALPLEPWQEQLVGLSALETMSFLIDAWLEIVAVDGRPAVAARVE